MAIVSESESVARSGDRLMWTFVVTNTEMSLFMTFDMRGEDDGTMSGSVTARSAWGDATTTPDVVMTPT
jgi:hypothetical protein